LQPILKRHCSTFFLLNARRSFKLKYNELKIRSKIIVLCALIFRFFERIRRR
jgi:hypothetical protein